MANSIHHEFHFSHSAKVVWDYLTSPDLMKQWLMENDFQPILGFDFQFRTKPIPSLSLDGIFYCKVLELLPFERLSYSWKGGPGEGKITLDSVVLWQLKATENGTALVLDHTGFKEANFAIFTGMNEGWMKNVQKILKLINEKNAAAHS